MESRKRSDRARYYDWLTQRRIRIQRLRINAVAGARGDLDFRLRVERELSDMSGLEKEYAYDLLAVFRLQKILTPGWYLSDIRQVGKYFIVTFSDHTGRGRPDFSNKFISESLEWVLIFSIISMHLIDLNSLLDEIRDTV